MKDIISEIYGLEYMDKFHDYRHGDSLWRLQHRQRAKIIFDQINKASDLNNSFLDAGAGRGAYSFMALDKYKKVFVFEYDSCELDIAEKNLKMDTRTELLFKKVDLNNIPLNNKSIDTIVMSEVLEHIPNKKKVLIEINRILKDDGEIIFSMPNSISFFLAI